MPEAFSNWVIIALACPLILSGCGTGTISAGIDDEIEAESVCTPGETRPCECPAGGQGTMTCNPEGTGYLACRCDSGPDAGQAAADVSPDGGTATDEQAKPDAGVDAGHDASTGQDAGQDESTANLPQECNDGEPVDLEPEPAKPRQSHVTLIQRFYADGSPADSVARATFVDTSLYNGTPPQAVDFGPNCRGYFGEGQPSDKHCEYTTDACENDEPCGQDVSCRATDRLVVGGVSISNVSGVENGRFSLEEQETGSYLKEGLPVIFDTDKLDTRINGSNEPFAFCEYGWSWFWIPPPRNVELIMPELAGSASMGEDDLPIRWKEILLSQYDSGQVRIDITGYQVSVQHPDTTRPIRLSCVVADDGCKVIPASAVQWLRQSDDQWQAAERFDFVIARRFRMTKSSSEDDQSVHTITLLNELHGSMLP